MRKGEIADYKHERIFDQRCCSPMSDSVDSNHGSHPNRYTPLVDLIQPDEYTKFPTSSCEARDVADDDCRIVSVNKEELAFPALERKEITTLNGLSWRSDPNASFSDWTIEVTTEEKGPSILYHCHSNVLVWGPRTSHVFMNLFHERMRQTPPSNVTQLVLPADEAAVFPILLDFIYCETTLRLSPGRVCSTYLLADRFENEPLMTAIQAFVENSLTFQQSIEFLSYARGYERKEEIERLVLFVNSKICGYLVQFPSKASQVPPELLAHMLYRRAQVIKVLKGEDPRKYSGDWECERSRLLSMVVAECCFKCISRKSRNHVLSPPTFRKLIDPKHLPALDGIAALRLLQVDSALQDYEDEGQRAEIDAEKKSNLPREKKSLSSLENRCIQALVSDWKRIFRGSNQKNLSVALAQINSNVLSKVLVLVSREYESLNIQSKNGHERRQDMIKK